MSARVAFVIPLALAITLLSCGRPAKVRTESTTGFMTVESADTSGRETRFRVGVSLHYRYTVQDAPLTPVRGTRMSAGGSDLGGPVLEVILGKPAAVSIGNEQPSFALVKTRTGEMAYGRIIDGVAVKVCVKTFDEAARTGTADVEAIYSPGPAAAPPAFYSVNDDLPFRVGEKVRLKEFADWPATDDRDAPQAGPERHER